MTNTPTSVSVMQPLDDVCGFFEVVEASSSVIGDAATRRRGRRSGRTTLLISQSLRGLRSSDPVAQRLHYQRPRGGGVRGAAAFAAMPEAM